MDFPPCTSDARGNTLVAGSHTIELYSCDGSLLSQHYSDDLVSPTASFSVDSPTPYILAAGGGEGGAKTTSLRLVSGDSDYTTFSTLHLKTGPRIVAVAAAAVGTTVGAALGADGSLLILDAASQTLRVSSTLNAGILWGAGGAAWGRGAEASGGLVATAFATRRGGAAAGILAAAWGASSQLALAVIAPDGTAQSTGLWSFGASIAACTVAASTMDASVVLVTVVTQAGNVVVRSLSGAAPKTFVEVSEEGRIHFAVPNGVSAWASSEAGAVFASPDRTTLFPVTFSALTGDFVASAADPIQLPTPAYSLAWPADQSRSVAVLLDTGLHVAPVHAPAAAVPNATAPLSGLRVMTAPQAELATLRSTFESNITNVQTLLSGKTKNVPLATFTARLDDLDAVAAAFYHREKALIGRVDPAHSAVFRSMEKLSSLRTRLRALLLIGEQRGVPLPPLERLAETHAANAERAKQLATKTLSLDSPTMVEAVASFYRGGYWDVHEGSLGINALASALRTTTNEAATDAWSTLHQCFDNANEFIPDPTVFALYVLYLAASAPRDSRVAFARFLNCPEQLVDLAAVVRAADQAPEDATDDIATAASALLGLPVLEPFTQHLLATAFASFVDAGNVVCASAVLQAIATVNAGMERLPARAMMRVFFLCSVRGDLHPLAVLSPSVESHDARALLLSSAAAAANLKCDADLLRNVVHGSAEVHHTAALLKPTLRIQLLTVARCYVEALAEAEAFAPPSPAGSEAAEAHSSLLSHLRALAVRTEGARAPAAASATARDTNRFFPTEDVTNGCCEAASSILQEGYEPQRPVTKARSAADQATAQQNARPVGLRSTATTAAPTTTVTGAPSTRVGHFTVGVPTAAPQTARCQVVQFNNRQPCDEPRPCRYHD